MLISLSQGRLCQNERDDDLYSRNKHESNIIISDGILNSIILNTRLWKMLSHNLKDTFFKSISKAYFGSQNKFREYLEI